MRKLASIQKVKEIKPIEGADFIELARILGWQCVVNKGQFKPGDFCVYFEIDSVLPIKPEFEFLRKTSYKKNDFMGEGFKLRTQKFKSEISQGLALPISEVLPNNDYTEGDDVTELIGVKEWSMPETVTGSGIAIGVRPEFIIKTDETRIQSAPALLEEFKGLPYYITTKCDGTSCSIGVREDGTFHLTGHNVEFKDEPGTSGFVDLIRSRGYEEKIRAYMEQHKIACMAVQGEFCGEGIQKNRLRLKAPEWFIFNVYEDRKRCGLEEIQNVVKAIGGVMVPVEETGGDLCRVYPDEESLLKRAEGFYETGGRAEGIVVRPQEPVVSSTLKGPLSMKVLNNKYLLKNEY